MFATFAIADLTPQRLTADEVTEVIKMAWKQMAGEEDKTKDEVTLFELREWCKLDLGRRGLLTKMFSGNVRGTVAKEAQADSNRKKLGERKFDGGRASIRFERALKKNGKTQMAAKREKEAISKLQKGKHGGNAAALSVDLREQARMRKRKLNAVATTNTMADLVIQTGMDLKNIMGLREDFADMINAQSEGALTKEKGHRKNAITLEQLSDVLFARFPDLEDGKSFRRALAVFDVDGDGYIDFDEFILALKRMDKDDDPTKQLKFIFDMFDESRDGEVELWEVSDAIEDHRQDIADMAKYCRGLAASLDIDGDDKININEFRESLKKEKVFINFCYEGLAPVHPTTNACVRAMAEAKARRLDALDAGAFTPRTPGYVAVAPALRPDGKVIRAKVSEESMATAGKHLFDALLAAFDRFTSVEILALDAAYAHVEEAWDFGTNGASSSPDDGGDDLGDADERRDTFGELFRLVEAEDGSADGVASSVGLWTALAKALIRLVSEPKDSLKMKATMLFKLIQSGHEKHNPGAIHIDVLAEETVSVEQVTGHLDRMEEQLTNDMEFLLFSFDEWDKDQSGSVTQDELVEYVMKEPRVMRMLQCIFFL